MSLQRSSAACLLAVTILPRAALSQEKPAWNYPPGTPPTVVDLSEDYLNGDFEAFARDLPEAWSTIGGDPLMEKNLMQLVDQAFAVNRGHLPGEFRLPSGIEKFKLEQRRTQNRSEIGYVVECVGVAKVGHKVRDLKLTRYPDDVVLDWHDSRLEHAEDDGGGFYVKRVDTVPVPEGLYKVTLTLDDGSGSEAWIPVVDWASDRSPIVVQPTPDQTYDSGNPVVSWNDYSTGDRGYSFRGFGAEVIYNDAPDYRWDKKWALYGKEGDRLQYTVGREASGQGVSVLGKGRYLFSLTYTEDRSVGDLTISKTSAERVPFYVH